MDFDFTIPGQHYSGLSNQALLEVRQREGRDFAANNATLRRHVLTELSLALETARRMPSRREVETLAGAIVVGWVVKRLDYKVRDVRIRTLTPAYALAKRRAGYGSMPPGVRTGAFRDDVTERARVVFA